MTFSIPFEYTFVQKVSLMYRKRIQIVFNPASGGGKTGEKKKEILTELWRQLGDTFIFTETQNKNDATEITRNAILNGSDKVIAVGGDGTICEVVNGFFENGSAEVSNGTLGVINCGTGQGFAQSIGLPSEIQAQINLIKNGYTRLIDLGKISFQNKIKFFVNEFQAGIGGAVVNSVSMNTKKKFGRFSFAAGALKNLLSFKGDKLQIYVNECIISENIIGLVVSNGRYTGGGMRLTPHAELDDGLLDVLLIADMPVLKRMAVFPAVYTAKHLYANEFRLLRTNTIEFTCVNNLPLEADGEIINDRCLKVDILPSALKVFTNRNGN